MSSWTLAVPLSAQLSCPGPWGLEETLRLGSIDGEVVLTHVIDMELSGEGEIYLTQSLVPEVQVFSPEGRPIGVVGRAGDGPGEFMTSALRLGWRGDTLWVTDLQGLHLFDSEGEPLESIRFRKFCPERASVYTPGPLLADGTVLPRRTLTGAGGGSVSEFFAAPELPIVRFSRSGDLVDTVLVLRQREFEGLERHPLRGETGTSAGGCPLLFRPTARPCSPSVS